MEARASRTTAAEATEQAAVPGGVEDSTGAEPAVDGEAVDAAEADETVASNQVPMTGATEAFTKMRGD